MNTMDCADIKAMLSGLIDDQVDAETRHLAERHLAQCKDCRDMLDEAEALDRLVAIEAEDSFRGLPAGFAEGVFAKIAAPETMLITPYAKRWTTWAGWFAAAASLALAVTLWTLRQDGAMTASGDRNAAGLEETVTAAAESATLTTQAPSVRPAVHRTPVFDAVLDPFADPALFTLPRTDDAFEAATTAADDVEAIVKEKSRELSALSDRATLSASDAQTLYSASVVLEMIVESDDGSFADIEMARQILEYDELLPRLAAVRMNLESAERTSVLAAEAILTRVVHGPIDLDDIGVLRDTVLDLKLVDEVAALSNRGPWGGSA